MREPNKYQEALDSIGAVKWTDELLLYPVTVKESHDKEIRVLKDLVYKATPRKPWNIVERPFHLRGTCPFCDKRISDYKNEYFHNAKGCGQALDWSKENETI